MKSINKKLNINDELLISLKKLPFWTDLYLLIDDYVSISKENISRKEMLFSSIENLLIVNGVDSYVLNLLTSKLKTLL